MVVLDATIVNVALPAMRRGLHLSGSELQWVVNAYLLALGGLILLGGRLGDHFGRKRMYLIGGAIFSTASLAGGIAPTGGVLLAARGVQGIGAALLAPGTLSLLTAAYTERRARTRALAVWSTTSASGGALGVFLGGVLTDVLGWRSVLFVNVPLGVLVVVLGGLALPNGPRREGPAKRLDVPGALTVTAALTALVYGVVETESHSWGSTQTLVVLAVALVLFVLAGAIESRASNALIPFSILRRRTVATATAMMTIHGAVMTAMIYFQSLYLQQVRDYSPFDAGVLLMPFALLAIATPTFVSPITTRYGPRRVAIVSIVVETVGIVWMSRWGAHGSILTQVVLPSMVIGFGASICFFCMSVLLTSDLEREHSGLGSGLFNAGRQVGGSIGLAALTVLAAAHTRSLLAAAHHAALAQATARGYGLSLVVAAVLLVAGIIILIAVPTDRRRRRALVTLDAEPRQAELAQH
jgi:EmrB/QacA subfamily drug resistance transporter